MYRAVLEACLPSLLYLVALLAGLFVLARIGGGRWQWSRLRTLHRCEQGGVQSLSLVLTLPFFVLFVLFVVQISQLMVGIAIVHYAAYAGARAASVWVPASIGNATGDEPANVIAAYAAQSGNRFRVSANGSNSVKLQKICTAAVLACTPISPSRDLTSNPQVPGWLSPLVASLQKLYPQLSGGEQNPRIPRRLLNKVSYSAQNTSVVVEWNAFPHPQRDIDRGPTYNPIGHPKHTNWNPSEVGWQDPLTVWVTHDFALLPGPGRFLAAKLVRADGGPDNVSGKIHLDRSRYNEPVYSISLTASATLVNEGYKSVMPYVQE
jgi:hypothetical protein